MTKQEIKSILENHAHYVNKDCDGWEKMAAKFDANEDLSGYDFSGMNLSGADFTHVNLSGANFTHCVLFGTAFAGACLSEAKFACACLSQASFERANLYRADFMSANLSWAYLSYSDCSYALFIGANLSHAKFFKANLRKAHFDDANVHNAVFESAHDVPPIPLACPSEGSFIGWKKAWSSPNFWDSEYWGGDASEACGAKQVLVKLEIPEDALRSSATTRKCRCDKAKVLCVTSLDGEERFNYAVSNYAYDFEYWVGETVCSEFEEDRFAECAPGIHFFINKKDAINYEF